MPNTPYETNDMYWLAYLYHLVTHGIILSYGPGLLYVAIDGILIPTSRA